MKKLITIILILVCGQAIATDYYFSMASGNDVTGAGTQISPWKSLTKAQTVFTTGNRLYFQRGDTWYGNLTAQGSGTNNARIFVGAYGTGAKPIITGFSSVTSWVNTGNVWTSSEAVSTLSSCNIAAINNINYAQGRTPNATYYTIDGTNGTNITSSSLNAGSVNWTGAEVVLRKYRWVMDKYTITGASGSTISFSNSGDGIQTGFGFFIQNDIRTLDVANEWSYSSTTKKISVFATSQPTNVKVPTVETAMDLTGRSYITIDNINFQGFNTSAINMPGCDDITITNCDFSFIGINGIYAYQQGGDASRFTVSGNTLTDIGSRGIWGGYSSNSLCTQNTLHRIGNFAGMGTNGDDSYTGLIFIGNNTTVSYNTIRKAGYCGIRWDGDATVISYNFIDSTNYVKDDGGGIYCYPVITGPSPTVTYTQRTVRNNIVLNSLGNKAGGEPSSNFDEAFGIYNDGTSPNTNYVKNTIVNAYYGFFSNAGHDNFLDSNTIYNCKRGLVYNNYDNFGIANVTVTNNVLVALNAGSVSCGATGQYPVYYEPNAANMPATFVADNNVYARPLDQVNGYVWRDFQGEGGDVCSSIAAWKTKTGKDANSTASPYTISSLNEMIIVYNATAGSVTQSLGANYRNLRQVSFNGSITLTPYSSDVLILNTSGNTPPTCTAIPSSTITLPVNSVSLNGVAASTSGGSISSWAWVKTSGPATGTISNASSQVATAVNLVQGTYVFTVTATDNNGLQCTATKNVTVNAALVIPTANAGSDQSITLPTNSVTLSGSGSGGTITSYFWSLLSGSCVGCNFGSNTSATTSFTGLTAGIYSVRLRVGNDDGNFGYDTVQITVYAAPVAPTCNAGTTPVTITLPTNSVGLTATGSGANSVSFFWERTSGPGTVTIANANTASTTVTGLIEGSHNFRITVTDNVSGLTCQSTKTVTVNAAVPLVPPTVNAGANQSIQLPTNQVTVTATAIAASGSITGYSWLKVSGPVSGTITSATSASTTITGLVAGVYTFSVTATQTNGLTATDTLQITVNAANSQPATGIKYLQASLWTNPSQTVLGWTSDITDNTKYFVLQKKTKNGTFGNRGANIIPKIGVVDYWAYDFKPVTGANTYRIKVVDKTGVTYSQVVTVVKKTSTSLGGNIILE